jgi:preprotein translocase subunit SecE
MKKQTKKKKKKGARKKTQAASKQKAPRKSDAAVVVTKEEAETKVQQPAPRREPERRPEKKEEKRVSVFRYVNVVGQFLREAKMELKKVKWPTRKELLASTAMVIFLVLFVALFLGLVDQGLLIFIRKIVR